MPTILNNRTALFDKSIIARSADILSASVQAKSDERTRAHFPETCLLSAIAVHRLRLNGGGQDVRALALRDFQNDCVRLLNTKRLSFDDKY